MNKQIIILISFMFFQKVYSQTDLPFLQTDKVWGVKDCHFENGGLGSSETCHMIYYKFEGDTTINSINYKKVYHTNDCIFFETADYSINNTQYIREDTANKVYLLDTYLDKEILLYDFGLSIGDSIYIKEHSQGYSEYAYVSSVDSILVNEEYRKRLVFDRDNETWIEGIGSLKDVLRPFAGEFTVDKSWELISVSISNQLVSSNENYLPSSIINCLDSDTDIETISDESSARIYPNPVNKMLYIRNQNLDSYNLSFFDITGKEVTTIGNIVGSQNIDVSALRSGLYVVKIWNNEHTMFERIVKN